VEIVSTSSDQVEVLRMVVGSAALLKFMIDHACGMWHYFDESPRSLIRYRYETGQSAVKVLLSVRNFRVFYVIRFIAAFTLLIGTLQSLSALIVAVWCFFEFTWDRKFNTAFIGLLCVVLATVEGSARYISIDASLASRGIADFLAASGQSPVTWTIQQCAVIFLVFIVYWTSAFRKLGSSQFMSGKVLQLWFERMATIDKELPKHRREYFLPAFFTTVLAVGQPQIVAKRWRPVSVATVAIEFALPVALLVPNLWIFSVAVGLAMHIGFTLLVPKRLVPFCIASMGSYVMFLHPDDFSRMQDFLADYLNLI